jgi:hypothetical protein
LWRRSYAWITFSNGFLAFLAVAPVCPVVVPGVLLVAVLGAGLLAGLVPADFAAPPAAPPAVAPVEAPLLAELVLVPADPVVGLADPAGEVVALAPGTVAPDESVLGTPVAAPAAAPGAELVVGGVDPAGAVTVRVTATVLSGPLEPVSDTNAAVSAPSESTITAPNAITGGRHRGVAARRVRAAAPQRKHQSCSSPSGVPHSGHRSPDGSCGGGSSDGGAGRLTATRPAA